MALKTAQVQIPYHIYMRLKDLADKMDAKEVSQFVDWQDDCYLADTEAKLVEYCMGPMVLPPVFGFMYTHFLMFDGLQSVGEKLNSGEL